MKDRPTILIADDSITGRGLLCSIFSDEYNIIQAADGLETIGLLKEHSSEIALVILDLYMPKMGGFEVLSAIHGDSTLSEIPVIVATSSEDIQSEIRALELGAVDLVIKPYDRRVISLRVKNILRRLYSNKKPSSLKNSLDSTQNQGAAKAGQIAKGIFEFSDGKLIALNVNNACYSLFGCIPNEDKETCKDLFDFICQDDKEVLQSKFDFLSDNGERLIFECRARNKQGEDIWVRLQASKAPYHEKENAVFECSFIDITELKNDGIRFKAYVLYDALTDIYNRTSFIDAVHERLRKQSNNDCVLIRLNIDRFKVVNEIFGAATGDEVLRGIAEILRESLSGTGNFGRLESDNFAVCFSMKSLDPMRFLKDTTETIQKRFSDYNIRISYGIYIIDDPILSVDVMCDRAGMALRTIKGNYFKQFALYNDGMLKAVVEEQEIVGEMAEALEKGQFGFALQPMLSSLSGKVIGAEALARWYHPTKGIIMPGRFIPIFEENGFITKLDNYIWEAVCKLISQWKKAGDDIIPISINVSRVNMLNPQLCTQLSQLVKKYDISPEYIKLEITESAYTDDPQHLRNVTKKLQQCGFKILMDDFGSGYSSLNMLKEIPVDILKIDSSFLKNFEAGSRGGRILSSVVRMAGWLGMSVVAEGVETQVHAEFMRSIGCESMQGYFFSPPLSVEEFEKFRRLQPPDMPQGKSLDYSDLDFDMLFDSNSHSVRFFNSIIGGMGLYELFNDRLEVIRVNSGYYEMFGYEPADFSEKIRSVFENISPENKDPILAACRRAVEWRGIEEITLRRRHCSGELMWINVKIRYLGGHRENPILYFALFDVTDKKKLEHELFLERYGKSKKRDYNEMFVVNICDNTYQRIQTNNEMLAFPEHIYYYDDMVSFVAENCVASQDKELVKEFMAISTIRDNFVYESEENSVEFRLKAADGSLDWYRFDVIYDEQYSAYLVGIRAADKAPKLSHQLCSIGNAVIEENGDFQGVLNSIPIGIAIYQYGEKLQTIYANDALFELYGYTREQYVREISQNAYTVIPQSELDKLKADVNKASVSERMTEKILKATRRDGAAQWVRIMGKAERTADGRVIIYTVQKNITAEVRANRRSRSRAEHFKVLLEDSNAVLFDYDIESGSLTYSVQINSERKSSTVPKYLNRMLYSKTIHHDMIMRKLSEASQNAISGELECKADFYDEGYRWYQMHYVSVQDDDGQVFRVVGRLFDIEEQKDAQIRLLDGLEYRNAMSAKALLVYEANLLTSETKLLHADEDFSKRFYPYDKYAMAAFDTRMIHPEDIGIVSYHFSYEHFYNEFVRGKTEHSCRYRIKTLEEKWVWVETATHLFKWQATGELKRLSYMSLIDEQMRRSSELREKAERDALTGLLNRATAEEQIRNALQGRSNNAFILFDVDNFKIINDNFGHMTGDGIIGAVGAILNRAFRGTDIVGRLGGDEFVVLLCGAMSESGILEKLSRVCCQINMLEGEYNGEFPINVSVGVAMSPDDGRSFESLYSCADQALYAAKKEGKGCVMFYSAIK